MAATTQDPVPTAARGIDATVQRGITKALRAGLVPVPLVAAPIDGDCAGAKAKRGTLLGRCYSCANWGPTGPRTHTPRIEWGAVPDCRDHVPVHGVSVPREQGVAQTADVGGVCVRYPTDGGVSA